MTAVRREIGDLLVDNGVITQEDLDLVKEEHAQTGNSVVDILSKKGLANENQLKNALELEYGVNFVDLLKPKTRPEDVAVRLLDEEFMRSNKVVGVSLKVDKLVLAMVDPSDQTAAASVRAKLPDVQVKTVVCVEDALFSFLNDFYNKPIESDEKSSNGDGITQESSDHAPSESSRDGRTESIQDSGAIQEGDPIVDGTGSIEPIESLTSVQNAGEIKTDEPRTDDTEGGDQTHSSDTKSAGAMEDAIEEAAHLQGAGAGSRSKTPTHTRLEAQTIPEANEQVEKAEEEAVVLLANQILGGAIKRGATHIHIIPGEREAVVNYRVGGALVVDRKLPKTIVTSVINRYKIMAKLSLSEKACLDGHIKVKSSSKEIVCLVSIIPTLHGEHAVVWIV